MQNLQKQLFLSLFIFDGEGGGGEGDSGSGENAGTAEGNVGIERAGSGDVTTDTAESEADIFDKFIKEHKSEYERRFKNELKERLKGTNKMRAEYEASKPVLDRVLSRYGAKDINELSSKLDADTEYYRNAAAEKGMSEEAFREYERMRLELEAQKQDMAQRQKDEFMQNLFRQAAAVKRDYPDFDLDREMENPEFLNLIKHGTPVDHAYKVLHLDDIITGAVAQARRAASAQTTDAIRSGKERANEIGTGRGTPGRAVGVDISKLTKEQCEEYERRAVRGQRVTFG